MGKKKKEKGSCRGTTNFFKERGRDEESSNGAANYSHNRSGLDLKI